MRMLLVLVGLAVSLAASGQEIYRWVDKDGIVHYSDTPGSANAELISVIEPNAYDSADTAVATSTSADRDEETRSAPAAYGSLTIVSPPADEVYFGADATVQATAELEGALEPDHSVAFFLNGNRQNGDGLSAQFAGLARGTYQLRASVLDADGAPVITSAPVTFHVRQPSINSPQSPQAPPKPPAKPTPKPSSAPKAPPPPRMPSSIPSAPGR
jgi:hypothetical protein